jgi:hypothetical protein
MADIFLNVTSLSLDFYRIHLACRCSLLFSFILSAAWLPYGSENCALSKREFGLTAEEVVSMEITARGMCQGIKDAGMSQIRKETESPIAGVFWPTFLIIRKKKVKKFLTKLSLHLAGNVVAGS